MTADTPAASKNVGHGKVTPRPDGVTARCFGPGVCPVCLQEEVATLTAKLEAERAKVSELADERDSFAGELDEANEKLDFIRDIEGALKAETARETERADAAVAEAKALREAVKSADALLGRILKHGEIAVLDVGSPFSTYGGKKPPSKEMWAVPRHMHAEIEELRATLAQPAADGGDNG